MRAGTFCCGGYNGSGFETTAISRLSARWRVRNEALSSSFLGPLPHTFSRLCIIFFESPAIGEGMRGSIRYVPAREYKMRYNSIRKGKAGNAPEMAPCLEKSSKWLTVCGFWGWKTDVGARGREGPSGTRLGPGGGE